MRYGQAGGGGRLGFTRGCGAPLGWVGVWRDLVSKGALWELESDEWVGSSCRKRPQSWWVRAPPDCSAMGTHMGLRNLLEGLVDGGRGEKEGMLSGSWVPGSLLDDRVGKGGMKTMGRHSRWDVRIQDTPGDVAGQL